MVVVYDIGNDARRARVRSILDPIADRFQQSGWLIPATAGVSARAIMAQLDLVATPGDRIRAHAPCLACARLARWLPQRQPHTLRTVSGWVVT